MCNAWGLGSLHVFMIVSGVLCILLALGGQAYGCVSPTLEPGYVCSDYEASLYLSNNLWQATIWAILILVTILLRPSRDALAAIWLPFILMGLVLLGYAFMMNTGDATTLWSGTASTLVWWALFALAYVRHEGPSQSPMA